MLEPQHRRVVCHEVNFGSDWSILTATEWMPWNSEEIQLTEESWWLRRSPDYGVHFFIQSKMSNQLLDGLKMETYIHIPIRKNKTDFTSYFFSCDHHQAIFRSKFQFIQYFGFWTKTCKTNNTPIGLSCNFEFSGSYYTCHTSVCASVSTSHVVGISI